MLKGLIVILTSVRGMWDEGCYVVHKAKEGNRRLGKYAIDSADVGCGVYGSYIGMLGKWSQSIKID